MGSVWVSADEFRFEEDVVHKRVAKARYNYKKCDFEEEDFLVAFGALLVLEEVFYLLFGFLSFL